MDHQILIDITPHIQATEWVLDLSEAVLAQELLVIMTSTLIQKDREG